VFLVFAIMIAEMNSELTFFLRTYYQNVTGSSAATSAGVTPHGSFGEHILLAWAEYVNINDESWGAWSSPLHFDAFQYRSMMLIFIPFVVRFVCQLIFRVAALCAPSSQLTQIDCDQSDMKVPGPFSCIALMSGIIVICIYAAKGDSLLFLLLLVVPFAWRACCTPVVNGNADTSDAMDGDNGGWCDSVFWRIGALSEVVVPLSIMVTSLLALIFMFTTCNLSVREVIEHRVMFSLFSNMCLSGVLTGIADLVDISARTYKEHVENMETEQTDELTLPPFNESVLFLTEAARSHTAHCFAISLIFEALFFCDNYSMLWRCLAGLLWYEYPQTNLITLPLVGVLRHWCGPKIKHLLLMWRPLCGLGATIAILYSIKPSSRSLVWLMQTEGTEWFMIPSFYLWARTIYYLMIMAFVYGPQYRTLHNVANHVNQAVHIRATPVSSTWLNVWEWMTDWRETSNATCSSTHAKSVSGTNNIRFFKAHKSDLNDGKSLLHRLGTGSK
jgi:hypothetical protein